MRAFEHPPVFGFNFNRTGGAANFRGESKISSWIFGIARFKGLEAIRNRSRLKRSRVIATDDDVISQVPDHNLTGTQLEGRQTLQRVAAVMQRLPGNQREALEMTVFDGLGLDEVAAHQNVSRDTVKTRVSRARRGLRRMLGHAGEGAPQ
jgi:RNA polymerase sigma-70 factor (ECF subfamily)